MAMALALSLPLTVHAQDAALEGEMQQGQPPQRIDIRVEPRPEEGEVYENCRDDQDAAVLTGEIVVCRRRSGDENRLYDKETAETRHAVRTMHHNDPQAPGLFGIPDHGPVVARGCFIPPCPKPPVYLIDFDKLPDTPAGSDADRMARGLAPRGSSGASDGPVVVSAQAGQQDNADELGLPPPLEQTEISP